MRERIVASIVAGLTLLVSVSLTGQSAKSTSGWTVPRMPDGHPDMQGVWANNSFTALERPKQFGTRATMTDAELDDLKKKAKAMMDGGDAFFADELFTAALEGKTKFSSADTQVGNYDQTWLSERVFDNRTSLIIDPPDGRIPALVPEAVQRARTEAAARQAKGSADRAQDLSLGTRCLSYGTPNIRAGYQSYFEITQGPAVVALRSEMIHDARIFPIDAGPHVSKAISQYHGDSRAHWEGDTLVVDTTNFVPDAFRLTNTQRLRLTEKFRRVAEDTVEYYLTLDDPSTWSRPWTLMLPLKKTGEGIFEFACHEGNYGIAAILSGARAQERPQSRDR
jgi:hypothetical protein